MEDMLGEMYSILFMAPHVLGYGPHWPLEDDEAQLLGERTQRLIQSLGKRKSAKVLAHIEKFLPGISLAFAAGIITIPRVRQTQHLLHEARSKNAATHSTQETARPNAPGNAATHAPSAAANNGHRDWRHAREVPLNGIDIDSYYAP